MSKPILCLFAILALTCATSTTSWIPKCGKYEIWTKFGCITSCKDPSFDDCGDFFPLIYDPKFCALDTKGNWNSFTFACQACNNHNYVGVRDGKCECPLIPCQ